MTATTRNRTYTYTFTVAAAVLVALVVGLLPSDAAGQEAPTPILVEPLTPRSTFTDDVAGQLRVKFSGQGTQALNFRDPSRIAVARITVQPGARFPWHTHPGPVIVTVDRGELVYVAARDCKHRPYGRGTAFVDPGRGYVHTAYNRTDRETVLIATFLEAPAEGPLTVPAEAPKGCHVPVGTHAH